MPKVKQFIVIERDTNTLSVIADLPTEGYVIPLSDRLDTRNDPVTNLLYSEFMYSVVKAKSTKRQSFKLAPPDPWMVAVAYLMYEGIVQGAAWDAVYHSPTPAQPI